MRRCLIVVASVLLLGSVASAEEASLEARLQALEERMAALEETVAELAGSQRPAAGLGLPETPARLPAGSPGYSRLNPAPTGTPLTVTVERLGETHTAEITLLEVVRGERALEMVMAANRLNGLPPAGHEYLLARIRFRLLAMSDPEASLDINGVDFTLVSSQGSEYAPLITIVPPRPDLAASIYQGAVREGWTVFQVALDDPAPLLTYGRDHQGRGGIWFKTQ